MESLDPSLELSVVWDIWGSAVGREHIIEGYYARGKFRDCLQKGGIMFDSQTGIR